MKEKEKCIYAHGIAKNICESSETYYEALEIVEKIQNEIQISIMTEPPKVSDKPLDRFGRKIKEIE